MKAFKFFGLSESWFKLVPKKERTFKSWNCGLSSTERINLNRVAKVLDKLGELNSCSVKNDTEHFFKNVFALITDYMKECGFETKVNSYDNYTFKKIK